MNDVSKPTIGDGGLSLPAWPERPDEVYGTAGDWLDYNTAMTGAYRARMEALKEVDERWRKNRRHYITEEELAEVDALLAACERKEGR